MLPSHNEIVYFLEVAKCLNLSRASERLGVTQPTLSLSIKKLEQNIGASLLIRSKSGVQLTKYGKEFQIHSRALLLQWEKLKSKSLMSSESLVGEYSFGSHTSVAIYSLPLILPKLLKEYPHFNIKLIHDLSRKVCEKVISFEIDFGLVINPIEHPDLIIHPLVKDEVTLYESKKNKNSNTLIADHNLVQTKEIILKMRKKKRTFERVIQCEDLEVICSLVAKGSGVGVLPGRVAAREKLIKLKEKSPVYMDQLSFIYRYDTIAKKTSSVLLKMLKENLK